MELDSQHGTEAFRCSSLMKVRMSRGRKQVFRAPEVLSELGEQFPFC